MTGIKRASRRGRSGSKATLGQCGQVIVLVVIAIAVLFGILGLANDVSYAWRAKLQMQSAADAAAVAGADALLLASGVSAKAAAQGVASQNGFTSGAGTPTNPSPVTVAVNNPPTSGPNAGNSSAVEVVISQAQPAHFVAILGFSSIPVSVRSVATAQSSRNCVYSLDPSASGALLLNSNASIISSCGVLVNSSSASAVVLNSNTSITAPSLGVVGGITGSGPLPPVTSTGVGAFSDPLSYLPAPSVSGSCTSLPPVDTNKTLNLSAGYYCGLTANSNSTVNLISSGTYSFAGNVILNSNVTLTGTGGVTLYFKSGSLSLNSNVSLSITAPTTGPYAGIAIFEDRADSATLMLNANTALSVTGAIYAPDASLILNSNVFTDIYSILVARTVTIDSNSAINIHSDYSSLPGGSPLKIAVTVE